MANLQDGGFKIIAWVNVFFQVYGTDDLRFSKSYKTRQAAILGIKQKWQYITTIPVKIPLEEWKLKKKNIDDWYKRKKNI